MQTMLKNTKIPSNSFTLVILIRSKENPRRIIRIIVNNEKGLSNKITA